MDFNSAQALPAFGQRLRQLRRAAGMKQSALSDLLNVAQSTVSRWEAGHQLPGEDLQQEVFRRLTEGQADDFALGRLVETSTSSIHLIEEATHKCLAFSRRRAIEWRNAQHQLIGISLWRFATEEIQEAERELENGDWWSVRLPKPRCFRTSAKTHSELTINAGNILWERMYLSDGTPVRLCTSFS